MSSRDLPPYDGPPLDPEKKALDLILGSSSGLASAPRTVVAVNFLQYTPPQLEPPPRYPGLLTEFKKPGSSLAPKPLRVGRKRNPPRFIESHGSYRYRTLSYTFCPVHDADKMASNPLRPDATTTLPSGPRPGLNGIQSKDELLADLRRQLDDTASDMGSSVTSRGGRRRRRRNKVVAPGGNLAQPAILPRLADTKPVRLQLGLNLDVEVELKARLQGDVSLTLL